MNPTVNPDRLDRILAKEDELLPSSGFLAGVMDRVREEAAAPPPIPFPWRRALPGMVFAIAVFVWAIVAFTRPVFAALRTARLADLHLPALPLAASGSTLLHGALWVAAALAVSLLALLFSRRLAGRRGLL